MEFCALLALSAFLLRLAVAYLLEIWVYLLIIAIIAIAGIIGWRVTSISAIWENGSSSNKKEWAYG